MNESTPLKIGQVPAFLEAHYGFRVTRQSVYNWITKGLRHATLRVERRPGGTITTPAYLREFFGTAGIDVSLNGTGL